MSSNIRIERICQHCGNQFVAKTTVTKYCGDDCAKRAYKVRQKKAKIESSIEETQAIKLKPIVELMTKEYLSISETCQLLGLSRWTVWRALKSNQIAATKIGRRTIIKRSHLEKLFEQPSPIVAKQDSAPNEVPISECYTLSEAQKVFGVSEKALYEIIKRNSIPKIKKGRYAYVPKNELDSLLIIKQHD